MRIAILALFLLMNWGLLDASPITSIYHRSPNLPIPDPLDNPGGIPEGITDSLTVPDTFLISHVRVTLDISHTWVGDLFVSLTHEATGASVVLLDRPGYPGSYAGCDGFNVDATFDDAGADGPAEDMCGFDPGIFGAAIPLTPLSVFIGENVSGIWTLFVEDRAEFDVGTLNAWSLEIAPVPEPSSFLLGLTGLAGLWLVWLARRRRLS